MAETALTSNTRDQAFGERSSMAIWTAIPNGNTGAPILMSTFSDRSVQVSGTFGAGGTVLLEGSNDGTTYATLTDPAGAAISFTAAGLKQVLHITKYMRPRVSAGDGTTAITVHLLIVGKG